MIKTLITIIILIIIPIIGTANGITIGVTTTNNCGTTLSDSITMNGDIGVTGKYTIDRSNIFEKISAHVGAGRLSEDTKLSINLGVVTPHHIDSSMSKLIKNVGDGSGSINTNVCVNGMLFGVVSYIRTDTGIDHGEMHSDIGNKITMQDNVDAIWHYENVQAESDLTYNGNGLTEVPMKINASPLPEKFYYQ